MSAAQGSALYHRAITYDYSDEQRRALMEKVWSVTPWMIDAFTGSMEGHRYREIMDWCRDQFGDEARPIHGREGMWQRGGATIHGWTWLGFDTEEKLNAFAAAWPSPKTDATPRKGEDKSHEKVRGLSAWWPHSPPFR